MPYANKYKNSYCFHRYGAKKRGIPFLLTYDQWLEIWILSGHLNERGRKKGQYVMARFDDKGPYAVGNVEIITCVENTRKQTKEVRDRMVMLLQNRATPCIDYLGNLMTIQQAIDAAGSDVEYGDVFKRLKIGWPHREAVEMPKGSRRKDWPSLKLS